MQPLLRVSLYLPINTLTLSENTKNGNIAFRTDYNYFSFYQARYARMVLSVRGFPRQGVGMSLCEDGVRQNVINVVSEYRQYPGSWIFEISNW